MYLMEAAKRTFVATTITKQTIFRDFYKLQTICDTTLGFARVRAHPRPKRTPLRGSVPALPRETGGAFTLFPVRLLQIQNEKLFWNRSFAAAVFEKRFVMALPFRPIFRQMVLHCQERRVVVSAPNSLTA